ncbi:ribonuclease P protein subunit p29-like [Branchiostoma floridae]|uniref:Ribonuclease P protein subunit p29 n=1 Tax=Branchiostoma floridae TaxID=7739 RepID=A0A9J7LCF3_BRAFL|nr:ribonuclease P protein subunit p29-like [Branchiostoma floridae]
MEENQEQDLLYQPLPQYVSEEKEKLGLQELSCPKDKFVESFLDRHIQNFKPNEKKELKKSYLLLDLPYRQKPTVGKKKNTSHSRKRREKKVYDIPPETQKSEGRKKVYDIPPEHQKYSLYVPLHNLWLQYIKDLLQVTPTSNLNLMQKKMLKADLHGALITVCKSRCPSYVGLTGIILQEGQKVFKVITKEDKLKTVPKANSVFSVEFEGLRAKIYGNHFCTRTAQRASKKFKLPMVKQTIDL